MGYIIFCTAFVLPTFLHFLVCFYFRILLYHFYQGVVCQQFFKRHLLTLLALNVAFMWLKNIDIQKLRYSCSEFISIRKLYCNRDVISAIKHIYIVLVLVPRVDSDK